MPTSRVPVCCYLLGRALSYFTFFSSPRFFSSFFLSSSFFCAPCIYPSPHHSTTLDISTCIFFEVLWGVPFARLRFLLVFELLPVITTHSPLFVSVFLPDVCRVHNIASAVGCSPFSLLYLCDLLQRANLYFSLCLLAFFFPQFPLFSF